jgi:hypothetical protein
MPTKIRYKGNELVAPVEGDKTVILPVKNKKMSSDIVVTVSESSSGGGGSSLSTCTLNTGSYPTSGSMFYTDADGTTQCMDINPGSGYVTITCGKIYVIGPVTPLGLMDDTSPGTEMSLSSNTMYCIEVPASKYAGKQVNFKHAFS